MLGQLLFGRNAELANSLLACANVKLVNIFIKMKNLDKTTDWPSDSIIRSLLDDDSVVVKSYWVV